MVGIYAALALIVSISAYVPYLRAIFRGETKPRKATWLVWTAVDLLIFSAMLAQGQLALQMGAYVLGAGSILALSFWRGEKGWTREDKIVLTGSGVAMALWFILDANAAIMMSLIAISIGSIPTWRATWRNPRSEPFVSWFMFWIGGLFGLLAISEWTLSSALGPVWFFVLQTVMVLLSFPTRRARLT